MTLAVSIGTGHSGSLIFSATSAGIFVNVGIVARAASGFCVAYSMLLLIARVKPSTTSSSSASCFFVTEYVPFG